MTISNNTNRASQKKWKAVVGVLMICYFSLTMIVPIIIAIFVVHLPYLQSHSPNERLAISFGLMAIVALVVIFEVLNNASLRSMVTGYKTLVGAVLGWCLFAWLIAELSGNTPGLAATLMPGTPYTSAFTINNAAYSGSRYKSVELTLHSQTDNSIYYVKLAKRLFNYSKFNNGDTIEVQGKETLLGIVLQSYRVKPLHVVGAQPIIPPDLAHKAAQGR